MNELLTSDPPALSMLMTDELFVVKEEKVPSPQISSSPAAHEVKAPSSNEFIYLGENNKYFLVLVNDPTHQHLNKEHLEMLLKILQAKGLDLRDVAILNINRHPGIPFQAMKDFFAPSRILFFGINPQHAGFPALASNEPKTEGNVKLLATYHFDEMKDDLNKKRSLWNALKTF